MAKLYYITLQWIFFYLYTALLCHTFIIALLLYCNVFYSYYTTFSITQKANISIRLIKCIIIGVLCYNTESCYHIRTNLPVLS